MRVVHVPFTPDNPYQALLIQALQAQGIDAVPAAKSKHAGLFARIFVLHKFINLSDKMDVLHIHWVSSWFNPGQKTRSGFFSQAVSVIMSSLVICELALLKLRGVKLVWTVHNLVKHERHGVSRELFFCRILARLVDQMIVHCPEARDLVMQAYRLSDGDKITSIPMGNYMCYENAISPAEARDRLALDPANRVFLFFGMIRPYKGILQLIEAFKLLDDSQARLLIVGSSRTKDFEQQVEQAAQADARIQLILAYVPDEDIQLYMNAADVVVLPFEDVLSSSSVVLAMSFGKTVIAPPIGCVADTLEGTGNVVYDPAAENGLRGALEKALTLDLDHIGAENLRQSIENDWGTVAQKTTEVYRRARAR